MAGHDAPDATDGAELGSFSACSRQPSRPLRTAASSQSLKRELSRKRSHVGTPADAADGAVSPLPSLLTTSACCGGTALCGDYGSGSMQRFMHLGGVCSLLHVAERMGARWRAPVIADGAVRGGAGDWRCRLRDHAVYPKRGSPAPFALWEVLEGGGGDGGGEFMWDGARGGSDGLWAAGCAADAAARAEGAAAAAPPEVLRDRIAAGGDAAALIEEVAAVAATPVPASPLMQPQTPLTFAAVVREHHTRPLSVVVLEGRRGFAELERRRDEERAQQSAQVGDRVREKRRKKGLPADGAAAKQARL
eukprot:gene20101-34121_t